MGRVVNKIIYRTLFEDYPVQEFFIKYNNIDSTVFKKYFTLDESELDTIYTIK